MATRLRAILAPNRDRCRATAKAAWWTAAGFGLLSTSLACTVATPAAASLSVTSSPSESETIRNSAKYSDGSTPEVEFVGDGSSSELPTWRPDGTPTPKNEIVERGYRYGHREPAKGHRYVVIGCEISGIPKIKSGEPSLDMPSCLTKLGGSADTGGAMGFNPWEGKLFKLSHFELPDNVRTADFVVGIGVGKFHEVAALEGGKGRLDATVVEGPLAHGSSTESGKLVEITWKSTEIHFKLPRQVLGKDWRLHIFDLSGKQLISNIRYQPDAKSPQRIAMCNNRPDTIGRVVLEARNYEWVKLRNIRVTRNGDASR